MISLYCRVKEVIINRFFLVFGHLTIRLESFILVFFFMDWFFIILIDEETEEVLHVEVIIVF